MRFRRGGALRTPGRRDPQRGLPAISPIEEFPEDTWDALVDLLLTSPFLLARAAWPHLRASGDGRVVAIASVHGLVASAFKVAYVSAKHGVLGLVKALALEGAPHRITATAVCPGVVRTPLIERQLPRLAETHGISEEQALTDVLLASQAVKRLIEPEEVAATVAFLLSPDGRSFTGTSLAIDQGWTAR